MKARAECTSGWQTLQAGVSDQQGQQNVDQSEGGAPELKPSSDLGGF